MTPVTWESVTKPAFNRLNKEKEFEGTIFKKGKATMKKFKKLFAFVVAAAMVLAMSLTAFADDKNDSITINGAKEGESYSIYKMFDLSVNSETEPTAYSYTVNEDWASFFGTGGAGAAYVTIDAQGYVTAISDAEALAKAAAASPAGSALDTIEASGETVEFTGLADGYYLITSTLGTFAMTETTPDKSAVEINEKNPEDTVAKKVKEDSTETYGESNDAQIGDTVEFKSTITLIKGTRNVVYHDTMDSGLTYTTGSAVIEDLTKGTDYTVDESPNSGATFEIKFTDTYLAGLTDTAELTLTYTAVLNENAIVNSAIVDQKNTANLTYGDAQTLDDFTTTTTHKFSVFKHATGETKNLADAVFSLKKNGTVVKLVKIDDINYRVANGAENGAVETFTTVDSGDIVIWGVDADDDYTLLEVQQPAGYNKLAEEVEVTVAEDNNTRADVENKAGTELPSTGGIGTTIFYILGSILVIGAGVLLVTKRRMDA